jgi:hypothetical protein
MRTAEIDLLVFKINGFSVAVSFISVFPKETLPMGI